MSIPDAHSFFSRVHDVAIFGAGYAGFAAALYLRQKGKKVIVVDRDAGLLWESGRAFMTRAGECSEPLWQEWICRLQGKNAHGMGMIQAAAAEIEATLLLREAGVDLLYYAAPMAVEMSGNLLASVILGVKSNGLCRLHAQQWIDATDEGELLRLLQPDFAIPAPLKKIATLCLRHAKWLADDEGELTLSLPPPISSLVWRHSPWQGERYLEAALAPDAELYQALPAALRAWREGPGKACDGAIVSHCSVVPLPVYAQTQVAKPSLPSNTAAACAWLSPLPKVALAARFASGIKSAKAITEAERCERRAGRFDQDVPENIMQATIVETQVAVAGLGTGGALSAIAAGRQGCRTMAFDIMPFAGGIGTGGGIPVYYYGMAGGLQADIDRRTRELDLLFAAPEQKPYQWHADAKKCVLAAMLAEAGVRIFHRTLFCRAEVWQRRIKSVLLATPQGPVRLKAEAWLDATGDGDLAAASGCGFRLGRDGDGRIHAYTQSCGQVGIAEGRPRLHVVNFDSGFVDPTDAEDLTRARIVGVCQHRRDDYSGEDRPTYIAPLVGLRQSRHVFAHTTVTLADLIERRTFSDSVGYVASHYDNHSSDYEFESDEGMFWVWACRAWANKIGSEIPYGALIAQDIDNLWLASRCLAVTHDSHMCFRMMRDIQRIGEVAGIAAALAVEGRTINRNVPIPELRLRLAASNALDPGHDGRDEYGCMAGVESLAPAREFRGLCQAEDAKRWLATLQDEKREFLPTRPREIKLVSLAMWLLYRHPHLCRDEILRLISEGKPAISWRAAAVAAMWGETAAEGRLCLAIETREDGREAGGAENRPDQWVRSVPNWLVAIVLLRRCGTERCLPALASIGAKPDAPLNVRTAIAITLNRIAQRGLEPAARAKAAEILSRLVDQPLPHDADLAPVYHLPPPRCHVREDASWQLHLVVAQARHSLGLSLGDAYRAYKADPRALVRKAFAAL